MFCSKRELASQTATNTATAYSTEIAKKVVCGSGKVSVNGPARRKQAGKLARRCRSTSERGLPMDINDTPGVFQTDSVHDECLCENRGKTSVRECGWDDL